MIRRYGPPLKDGLLKMPPEQGRIQRGGRSPPKTCGSNFIHHDFVQLWKCNSENNNRDL